jgi:glycosyltransferase involved in cell wall biosynthesis
MNAGSGGSRPIRVLHLRDSPWVDGPGRTILETAKRIDRSRIDYHVGAFVSNPGEPHPLVDALREHGLPVHAIEDRGGVGREIVNTIVELLDRLQIDILHTSEFRSNVLGLLCRRRRPVRLVSTAHGWIGNDLRGRAYIFADRVLMRRFDRVILVSHAMRQRLPRWWVPDSRVRILHNALMVDSYGENFSLRGSEPGSHDVVNLLSVGRLSPEKGQALLLRALARLIVEYPGIRVRFAGTGPLDRELRRLADELGLAEYVSFLGYVRDMPSLYAATDLVVQSSFTEGLPNVILETAFLGVPVVATAVGGTAEVIEHGVSGWLVEPGSVDELERGIRAFLEQPLRFAEMARAGRRVIERKFNFEVRTEVQTGIYQECILAR